MAAAGVISKGLIGFVLPAMAIFFLPWLPWLVCSFKLRYLSADAQWAVRLLMLVWAVAIVLFFSIPRSKLLGYVLPAVLQANSTRSFGAALSAQRAASEPIYMLERYYFDLPFYARLVAPVGVVDDWSDPETTRRDGPAKELSDAGSFDQTLAAAVLVDSAALPKRLCSAPVSWVIGRASAADKYPFLSSAAIVHVHDDKTLWRVDTQAAALRSALGCS